MNRNTVYSLLAALLLAVVAIFFFFPDDIQGNVLQQHDMTQGIANGQEIQAYKEATGETSRWTDAYVPDFPFICRKRDARLADASLRPLAACSGKPALQHDAGILHNVPMHALQVEQRSFRGGGMGAVHLLHNNHRRRTHLEVRDAQLHTAYNRRHCALLSRQVSCGHGVDRSFRCAPDSEQPCADDLLFPVCGSLHDACVALDCRQGKED